MDSKGSTSTLFKMLDISNSIDTFIDSNEADLEVTSFEEHLSQLSKRKNLSIPSIIDLASLSESYIYQLFKGTRKPSRDKIIQLIFGMKLSLEESNKLLRAGEKNELYCRNKRDAIVIFAINNHLSINEVEEILLDRGLESIVNLR